MYKRSKLQELYQPYFMKQPVTYPLVMILLALVSCAKPPQKFEEKEAYQFQAIDGKPNYADLHFWAAHPYKHDPSDSVPEPLRANYRADSTVDIFFIHPTSYTSVEKSFGWNADIQDPALNGKTDMGSILYQASVFNAAGRVFAPRYRQAHLSAYFPKDQSDSVEAAKAFEIAYQDVKAAFQYYLAHYNNGRPIVIASHSQGSTHSKRLLKEFFDGTVLKNKLVVAYVVGMVFDPNYLNTIPACENQNQTGCVCAWRTYKNNYIPPFVEKEPFNSIVTNPLTWNISTPHADRDQNKGGILLNFNKLVPGVTDATVTNKILWAEKPHFFGNLFYNSKNYHIADYNLYYLSIRENVQTRINAFWK
jgi:hypothetical protein